MTTPTTQLEAVNVMMSSIGEAPVSSLSSGLIDAELAETILGNINREVQSQGWDFNREYKYPLVPNSITKEITVPANAMRVDGSEDTTTEIITQRGTKLYNKVAHNYTFSEAVKVNITFLLGFEEIPEVARRYITLRAARVFQDRTIGASDLHSFGQRDEQEALMELRELEADHADLNIFNNSDVYATINRRG
jgi:hypothetical protein